jgi:hypothetical protein
MSDASELVHVDPARLRTRGNVRTDLQLTPEFLDSIAALGVQVPIVATRAAHGGLDIELGHRRGAAAVRAGSADERPATWDSRPGTRGGTGWASDAGQAHPTRAQLPVRHPDTHPITLTWTCPTPGDGTEQSD